MRGLVVALDVAASRSFAELQLTPRLAVRASKPTTSGTKVRLTCSLDCTYTVSLDRRRLTGTAVANAGPPGSVRLSFSSR